MDLIKKLLLEFEREAAVTRKYMERVPMEKVDWKPHKKSMALGRLATHVAEIIGYWHSMNLLNGDELDFSRRDFIPRVAQNKDELLNIFEEGLTKSRQLLESSHDGELQKIWTMKDGDTIFMKISKYDACRMLCLNHLYHHRAQLGVYFRLLYVPVPATYGPSADESFG